MTLHKKSHYSLEDYRNVVPIALLSVILHSVGITDWRYGYVGDEIGYFDYANAIANENLLTNPFRLDGVYGLERVLGSYWQGIWIWLFGPNLVAWRFSNVILIGPVVLFVYFGLKRLFGRTEAVVGAVLIGSSYFLINFFKIGYTHPVCFLLFTASFYGASRALMLGTFRDFLFFGLMLSLSFYLYVGPVFIATLGGAVFLLRFPTIRSDRRKWGALLLVYTTIVTIGFISTPPEKWFGGVAKTSLAAEFDDDSQMAVNVFRNFFLFYILESQEFCNRDGSASAKASRGYVGSRFKAKRENFAYPVRARAAPLEISR